MFSSRRVARRVSNESWMTKWTRSCCLVSMILLLPGVKTRSVSGGQDGGVMDTDIGMGVGTVGLMGSDSVGFLACTGGGTMDMVRLSAEGGPSQVGLYQSSCEFKDHGKC